MRIDTASDVNDAPPASCLWTIARELDVVNQIPELETKRISAAYEIRVRALLGGELPDVLMLRGRLDPQQWALEWRLPWWLGVAYGLDASLSEQICLSNVVGLASIRLRDDLEDGELPGATDAAAASSMSDLLHEAALEVYRRTFDGRSPFWTHLRERMSEWRAANVDGGSTRRLASRGAPLKISAFAVCVLTNRQDRFALIDQSLDHALAAMVQYDHLIDWRTDLAARRWNAFVAASTKALDGGQASDSDVQLAMLTTDVIRDYVSEIVTGLHRAATLASAAEVPGLASHLAQVAGALGEEGATLASRHRDILERGQQLLFGNQPPVAA